MRVGLGDIPAKQRGNPLTRTVVKWMVVHSPMRAPPGKVRTLPEMLISAPTTWEDDLHACRVLIDRLATTSVTVPHPVFGRLSVDDWGRLSWKHLDHHLRQFGL